MRAAAWRTLTDDAVRPAPELSGIREQAAYGWPDAVRWSPDFLKRCGAACRQDPSPFLRQCRALRAAMSMY